MWSQKQVIVSQLVEVQNEIKNTDSRNFQKIYSLLDKEAALELALKELNDSENNEQKD